MKVIASCNETSQVRPLTFADTKAGDVFKFKGAVYIRSSNSWSLNLSTNDASYLYSNDIITLLPHAVLVTNEEKKS